MAFRIIYRDNGHPTDQFEKPTWDEAMRLVRKHVGPMSERAVADLRQGEQIEVGDCETVEIQKV